MITPTEVITAYADWYNGLLRSGSLPLRSTDKGFWGATPSDALVDLLQLLQLKKFNTFCDLGSGDGKVVMLAALHGIHADGVESDQDLHTQAVRMKQKFWLSNVTLFNKDYYTHSISDYDVVFINPDQSPHRGLNMKLNKELHGHLIVFGPHFHPKNLTKENEIMLSGNVISHYTHPKHKPKLRHLIDT